MKNTVNNIVFLYLNVATLTKHKISHLSEIFDSNEYDITSLCDEYVETKL